ncbi:MAG: HD domain-containing protein, partial [Candidatus Subteraquimicrobiales bacterium]|nr:HD domain-containing protein [Candidatus Subteraquimicrobiales bacterium]
MESTTLEEIKQDKEVMAYIKKADQYMAAIGYTEHGERHANLVSSIARNILSRLSYPKEVVELAAIAGYLHDIGNVIGRDYHGTASALFAKSVLEKHGAGPSEIATIMNAIGNHEEEHGFITSEVCAALILADKSDVHRTRVRNPELTTFDIHDRVNYAAKKSFLRVDETEKKIFLEIEIDTEISQVMEYFEIFLSRMVICRR